jgi:hypothetical protein
LGIDEAVAIQGFMNRIQKATMDSGGNVRMSCSDYLLPLCMPETGNVGEAWRLDGVTDPK